MADIVEIFEEALRSSGKKEQLEKLLSSGAATYSDAYDYAEEIGKLASETLLKEYGGKTAEELAVAVTEEILQQTISPVLNRDFVQVRSYTQTVQRILNKKAGLGLQSVDVAINTERLDNLIKKAMSEIDEGKDPQWLFEEPVINFSQSIVDQIQKANVEEHYKAGLNPVIKRIAAPHCCEWCSNLAGTFNYPDDVPSDVYRRHSFCRCKVVYVPTKGKAQALNGGKDTSTFNQGKQTKARRQRITRSKAQSFDKMSIQQLRQYEKDIAAESTLGFTAKGGSRQEVIESIQQMRAAQKKASK